MAIVSVEGATLLYGEHDLSGISNEFSASHERAQLDKTVFTSNGWEELEPGLRSLNWTLNGLWDTGTAGQPEESWFSDDSGNPVIATLTNPASEGDVAYFTNPTRSSYSADVPVGDLVRYTLEFVGDQAVRGIILDNQNLTATGSTTGVQHGTVASGDSAYAAIVVYGGTFTTLDAVIESDDNAGFTSAVTRFTFTQATGVTSEVLTPLAGPVTDDYWRVTYTLVGTDVDVAVFFGIQ